jgi:hypothetical protein
VHKKLHLTKFVHHDKMVRLVAALLLLIAANAFTVVPTCMRHRNLIRASTATNMFPAEKMTVSASITQTLSRQEGQALMDNTLLPSTEYGNRIKTGGDAQGLLSTCVAVSPNDPRMVLTYGEFPLVSLDELLDRSLPLIVNGSRSGNTTCIHMLDVGSGCGRLALYVALTRGGTPEQQPWQVHGIEISPMLHQIALRALSKGYQEGSFTDYQEKSVLLSSIHLHLGAVEEWTQVLQCTNLVFLYSTAFPTTRFSEEWGAMILGQEWSGLLSKTCPTGCVVVTTDRALDPDDGWDLVDRLDVENREVMGSTGYIHVLRR